MLLSGFYITLEMLLCIPGKTLLECNTLKKKSVAHQHFLNSCCSYRCSGCLDRMGTGAELVDEFEFVPCDCRKFVIDDCY